MVRSIAFWATMFMLLNFSSFEARSQFVWVKHPSNPVIPHWTGDIDDPSGYKYVFGPTVLMVETKIYYMVFVSLAFGYGTSFCASDAVSFDGLNWYLRAKNPILRPGPAGSFDSRNIRNHGLVQDGINHKLYYTGDNEIRTEIGLATSPDRITWTKHPSNPLIRVGASGTWESVQVRQPAIIIEGNVYKMWYEGYNGATRSIGYATSTDGINWTKYTGNPVLVAGPGSFDITGVGEPAVVKVGNVYHMTYTGYDNTGTGRIGYAYSSDGITWQKYSGNPILQLGSPGSWDDSYLASGALLYKDRKFHLWYNGRNSFTQWWQIGYATSDSTFTSLIGGPEIPTSFQVRQNYPNPFNPETIIQYDVPAGGKITIRIFDSLGRQVRTLFSGEQEPGTHTIRWNAKDMDDNPVSSGMYFVRVDYIAHRGEVKTENCKLLLLR